MPKGQKKMELFNKCCVSNQSLDRFWKNIIVYSFIYLFFIKIFKLNEGMTYILYKLSSFLSFKRKINCFIKRFGRNKRRLKDGVMDKDVLGEYISRNNIHFKKQIK